MFGKCVCNYVCSSGKSVVMAISNAMNVFAKALARNPTTTSSDQTVYK